MDLEETEARNTVLAKAGSSVIDRSKLFES
jgi:hypothetical protein